MINNIQDAVKADERCNFGLSKKTKENIRSGIWCTVLFGIYILILMICSH